MTRRAVAAGWLVMVAVVLAGEARAASPIILPRPGQVGIGAQGGWGALASSGTFGEEFGSGPTVAFRLRYRMRYERALGLSFENQRFDLRVPDPPDPQDPNLAGRSHLNVVLSGLELYQLFGTRTRTTQMIMVGAGLAQSSVRTLDKDTLFPGDGAYLSAGAGVEHFFMRSWAFDLSARYAVLFHEGSRNHDLQAALGIMFYASY